MQESDRRRSEPGVEQSANSRDSRIVSEAVWLEAGRMKIQISDGAKHSPLTSGASKAEILCWIIEEQQKDIRLFKYTTLAIVVIFITYLVTGKLVWGEFGVP